MCKKQQMLTKNFIIIPYFKSKNVQKCAKEQSIA